MAKKALEKLDNEIKELSYILTTTLPKEIQAAAAQGDLSENAEYEAALDKQRLLQSKIRKLNKRRAEVAIMDFSKLPNDKVGYSSTVVLYDLDEDKEVTFTLLMPEEIEDSKSEISISSPIGKALLGRKEGDEVEVKVPSGTKNFEISELTTIHDK